MEIFNYSNYSLQGYPLKDRTLIFNNNFKFFISAGLMVKLVYGLVCSIITWIQNEMKK